MVAGVNNTSDAVKVPGGLLEFSMWSPVPGQQEKTYVCCKTGARAALATKTLNNLGYPNAIAVDTGGQAWVKAGYPEQTSIFDETVILQPAR